jgi:CRP/FNR family transcriptional regulator, anaerobic regulatory protein
MDSQSATSKVINIHQLKTVCSSCSLRELCLPMGLSREEIEHLDQLVYTR